MAIPKAKSPEVRYAKKFHRVGGVRVTARDAKRASFLEQVAKTKPTDEFLKEARAMAHEVQVAKDATFLDRFRRTLPV
ncbi:hypothetical protein [Comamonas sp. BIGb0124]|uniref:hypothetical protein n=1 Tax=Comamonas sp. BIGb0124 TaxID=2485130 RepID=UPI0011CE95F3|nr:hypothetical protein [Comamonas sp. BIGb0124]